jgi:hypothetical protein
MRLLEANLHEGIDSALVLLGSRLGVLSIACRWLNATPGAQPSLYEYFDQRDDAIDIF